MASKTASQKAAVKKKAAANPDKPPKADTSGDGIPDARRGEAAPEGA